MARARRSEMVGAALALTLLGTVGCGEPAAEGPQQRKPTPGCVAPAGVSTSPQSIGESLALINALPKPLTLPCFLAALERPLFVRAANSVVSAQPAQGARSPRVFIFQGPNVMSIVPDGDGAPLLEFGEERPNFRSLKAEIPFPVVAQLPPTAPFEKLNFTPTITNCGLCHADEAVEPNALGIETYVSRALRPFAQQHVPSQRIAEELAICDRALEPERCAMLDGLMGWGPVYDQDFPFEMSTF